MEHICRSSVLFVSNLFQGVIKATWKPKYIKGVLPFFLTASLVVSMISPVAVFAKPSAPVDPTAPCNASDVIVNGSFEDPIVVTPENWDIYDSIPGWQAEWVTPIKGEPKIELQTTPLNTWTTPYGSQWTELDTDFHSPSEGVSGEDPASIKLYQDVPVVYGARYKLSFYTAPRPGYGVADNNTEVKWGSTVLGTITEDGGASDSALDWGSKHTYTVTATDDTMRLAFTDKGVSNSFGMFLDNVSLTRICASGTCDLGQGAGWYGEYFNYPANHEDMNLDSSLWPDKTHGNPMGSWTADWYTDPYFRFTRVDNNLMFGDNFLPFDGTNGATALEEDNYNGEDYHFGVHWSALVSGNEGSHDFTLKTDDDAWVYLDGVLVADNSGIHAPSSIDGAMTFGETPKVVDIYFAERHTVQSYMSFNFTNQEDQIKVVPFNRDCVLTEADLELTKVEEYDSTTGQITYDIDWTIHGTGTLYDATITDELPTGTTFVSADNGGTESGGTVTWNLGDKTAGDSGTVQLIVSIDSYDPWADGQSHFTQGKQKNGSSVIGERSHPEKALGEAENDDTVNFVSLGFGGSLVLEFDNYIMDESGDDIAVTETSYGSPSDTNYPEKVEVFASQTGSVWVSLGQDIQDGTYDLADGSLGWAKYLKLVDVSDKTSAKFPADADGFDIDGVKVLHSAPKECTIANSADFSGATMDTAEDELVIQEVEEDDQSAERISVTATATTVFDCPAPTQVEPKATIVAHKIVCDSEEYLPNWGDGGHGPITATTAQDFVNASQGKCHFQEGWQFQWAPKGTANPGDTIVGDGGAAWATLPATDTEGKTTISLTASDIEGSDYIWFREVLQEGYIPFSGWLSNGSNTPTETDMVSAEVYANTDVLNYDNYDRIDGIQLDKTYYAVAFNVLKPQEPGADETPGSVMGMKFNDFNNNGTKDANESGLENWTIYAGKFIKSLLVDSHDDSGITDIDVPSTVNDGASVSVDVEGGKQYIFRASSTFDAGDSITADAQYSKRLNPAWTDVVDTYGVYGKELLDLWVDGTASLWGSYNPNHVYWYTYDATMNGQVDFHIHDIYAQNNLGSLKVDVYEVVSSATTDSDGNYTLAIPAEVTGDVIIAEQTQLGWTQTAPSGDSDTFGYYTVSADEDSTGKDFGNRQANTTGLGSISGMKFEDVEELGVKNSGEPGIEQWIITLESDKLDGGTLSILTDADGAYTFANLKPGTYTVREEARSGWTQTYPNDPTTYTLVVGNDGENVAWDWTAVDFGNHKGSTGGVEIVGGGGSPVGGGGSYSSPAPSNEDVAGDQLTADPTLALADPNNEAVGGAQDMPSTGMSGAMVFGLAGLISLAATSLFMFRRKKSELEG